MVCALAVVGPLALDQRDGARELRPVAGADTCYKISSIIRGDGGTLVSLGHQGNFVSRCNAPHRLVEGCKCRLGVNRQLNISRVVKCQLVFQR